MMWAADVSLRKAAFLGIAVLAVGLLDCGWLAWGPEPPGGSAFAYYDGPTDEDRERVAQVLSEGTPEEITAKLMGLLLSERWGLAHLAAEELRERELDEAQINHLEHIVALVPFRPLAYDRVLDYPGAGVSGSHAWEVLAEAKLRGRPVAEQIAWLMGELRYARPFRTSRSDAAADRLGKIGAPAVPALARALRRDNSNAQVWAARTLMGIATEEAKTAVEEWGIGVLEATDDELIWGAAAQWLGKLKCQKAHDPLVRMLWAHLDQPRTWQILDALADLGDPRTRAVLGRLLEEHQPDEQHPERVRTYARAAQALVELGDPRGEEALLEAANSPLASLRREAAFAIYASLRERGRDVLVKLAADEDEAVAGYAKYWLGELDRAARAGSAGGTE